MTFEVHVLQTVQTCTASTLYIIKHQGCVSSTPVHIILEENEWSIHIDILLYLFRKSDINICTLRLTYNIRRNYFLSFDALFDPEKILYRLHYMVSAKRFTMFNRQKGYNPIKINFSHYCINFCSKNQNIGNLNRKCILFKHQSVKGKR